MKKFAIVYGNLKTPIQKVAVEELTRILLDYTMEYPVCIEYSEGMDLSEFTPIYIGTKENNPYIKKCSSELTRSESYSIKVKNGIVVIEGADDAGTLYGVLDFYNRYIVKYEHPDTDKYWVNFLQGDSLPDFEYFSAPMVKERGLWTWGHVIYDYRGYLDNMMRLKINGVIIWNDYVPVNARDIVEYAHARNIRIYWGFAWLWDTDCGRFDVRNLDGYSEEILAKYEREYAATGADGIYFQTFTELNRDNIDGVIIAKAAADFVNKTAALFYEKYPSLEIQFGLHANSVKEKLEYIKTVDSRIRIVWENCGDFPFSYVPFDVNNKEWSMSFLEQILTLRGEGERFGAVTKGLVKLDWSQFEHPAGPQCQGVSSKAVKDNRIERKRRIWRYIQAGWLCHSDRALEAVRKMVEYQKDDLSVFALVEDGMFEENIMYPVALYAEMLWNTDSDLESLTRSVALRSYITFA